MSEIDSEIPVAKRANRVRWAAGAVAVIVALLVGVLAARPSADLQVADAPLVGRQAPPVQGKALDGATVNLADYKGRYVVLNFFATWCGPCRQEHPEIKAFSERHPGETGPAVIAVAYDRNDIDNARSFFAQHGGTWPVVADKGSEIAVRYGVRGLPESFIIDPDGNVKARISGALQADALDTLTGQL